MDGFIFAVVVMALFFAVIIGITEFQKYLYEQKRTEYDALAVCEKLTHIQGLPGTGAEKCTVFVRDNKVFINTPGREFTVPVERIRNVVVTQDTRTETTIDTKTKKSPSIGKACCRRGFIRTGRSGYRRNFGKI